MTRLKTCTDCICVTILYYTVGDRAFPVAAARMWNSLPKHVTSAQHFDGCLPVAPQVPPLLHFLPQYLISDHTETPIVILDTLIVLASNLLTIHMETREGRGRLAYIHCK